MPAGLDPLGPLDPPYFEQLLWSWRPKPMSPTYQEVLWVIANPSSNAGHLGYTELTRGDVRVKVSYDRNPNCTEIVAAKYV
jgi:hypothetical protein